VKSLLKCGEKARGGKKEEKIKEKVRGCKVS